MARRPAYRRMPNLGIHDPPEPSPDVLSGEAREEWDRAYEQAHRAYRDAGIAESSAWRVVRMGYEETSDRMWNACANGQCVPWPKPAMLPAPKTDLVGLGVLIEYGYVDREGNLHIKQPDRQMPPILWWDDVQKLLYAFPGTPYPGCMLEKNPGTLQGDVPGAQVYKRWTKRNPQCVDSLKIPILKMKCVGVGDTVSYRSDKWKKERSDDPRVPGYQEYIHKHWHGVWVWQDRETDPRAIIIQGGALDLHPKGLIH